MSTSEETVQRELAAIDAALTADHPTAEDAAERELQELALLLRAESPLPDEAFAADLEADVSDGFPRERGMLEARAAAALDRLRAALRRVRALHFRRPLALLAGLASLLVAVVVVVSLEPGKGSSRSKPVAGLAQGSARDLRGGRAPAANSAPGPLAGSRARGGNAVPLSLPPSPLPPGGRDRRVERFADLTLAAPRDRLDRVADGIVALTDRYQGFVLRSSVTTDDEGTSGGSFELRIPADRVRPALRDLSALADVRSRTQSGQDVTGEYLSARDRLRAARAERRGLLRRLERADTDARAEAIRRRLAIVASQIRGLRSEFRNLRLRVDLATVTVSLVEKGADHGGAGGAGDTHDALHDALGSIVGSFNLALRVLGVAFPLAVVALLGWLATRTVVRRRREAVLS